MCVCAAVRLSRLFPFTSLICTIVAGVAECESPPQLSVSVGSRMNDCCRLFDAIRFDEGGNWVMVVSFWGGELDGRT